MNDRRTLLEASISAAEHSSQTHTAQAEVHAKKGALVGNLRGVCFLAFVAGLSFLGLGEDATARLGGGILTLLSATCFLALVSWHDRVQEDENRERRRAVVHDHRARRLSGRGSSLPDRGDEFREGEHPYADDLDLFGLGSVYQQLNTAHTHFGRRTLARWLLVPAVPETIHRRQETVRELSELPEFRVEFETEAMGLIEHKRRGTFEVALTPDPGRLLDWLKKPRTLQHPLLVALCHFGPILTVGGIVLQIVWSTTPILWIVGLALNLVLLSLSAQRANDVFQAVSQTQGAFLRYGTLLALLEQLEPRSAGLTELKQRLRSEQSDKGPSQAMRKFRTWVSFYDLRHNGMVYPFIDALFLWSFHFSYRLENWKEEVGSQPEVWFATLGEVEALHTFASLLAEDPDATLPVVDSTLGGLEAVSQGHPLLRADERVKNDVPTLRFGHALLITGSNMSGKSTFLRALGVNVVLALAGGPVIAERFALAPLLLGTSLRISDSLLSATSHFFAEVKKLAAIVERANPEEPLLFLLDEVLHGTNSRERQIGARWVLGELLTRGATGALTTHDEGLCKLDSTLAEKVELYHFRENVEAGHMSFDYKLRPGPVRSGNALRLMRAVGLSVPLHDENS